MQFWCEMIPVPSNRTGAHFDIRRMTFIPATVLQSVLLTLLISTQFSLTSLANIWTTAWLFYLFENVRVYRHRLQIVFTPPPPGHTRFCLKMYTDKPWISWGNSRHFATPPLASPRNDVRGTRNCRNSILPRSESAFDFLKQIPSWLDQSEVLPRSG